MNQGANKYLPAFLIVSLPIYSAGCKTENFKFLITLLPRAYCLMPFFILFADFPNQ